MLPWRGESPGHRPHVLRHPHARRQPVLRRPAPRAEARARQGRRPRASRFYTHPEIEFFLLEQGFAKGEVPEPIDQVGYFDHSPHGLGYDFRRQAITMLEAMGISVEFSHHEGAPGQQEIDLRYADALTTADNIMTFRLVMKEVALEQGVYATFMPKPFADHPGSGMHTHLSLFEGDRNAFYEAGAEYQLSKVGRSFIAGLLQPRAGDHRGHEPVGQLLQAARRRRRGAGVRLLGPQQPLAPSCACPMYKPSKGNATRVEFRSIDTAANPYLAFAVMLAAGLKGIEQGYELPAGRRGRRLGAHRVRAPRARHRAAADLARPGPHGDGAQRARRRDPRRARLRLLPAQQASRSGPTTAARSPRSSSRATCPSSSRADGQPDDLPDHRGSRRARPPARRPERPHRPACAARRVVGGGRRRGRRAARRPGRGRADRAARRRRRPRRAGRRDGRVGGPRRAVAAGRAHASSPAPWPPASRCSASASAAR